MTKFLITTIGLVMLTACTSKDSAPATDTATKDTVVVLDTIKTADTVTK